MVINFISAFQMTELTTRPFNFSELLHAGHHDKCSYLFFYLTLIIMNILLPINKETGSEKKATTQDHKASKERRVSLNPKLR